MKDEKQIGSSGKYIFHFEISGIIKSGHPLKILFILILFLKFHFEIFGIIFNDEQILKTII